MATGRTQAERRAASQRRVLDAAAVLVARAGSTAGVGMAAIAERAGVSSGLPSYLFGSKRDLLAALVADLLDRFREERHDAPPDGGLEAVVASVEAFLATLHRPLPHTRALYVLLGEAFADPVLRAAVDDHHERMRARFRAWIAAGAADGSVRGDVDPDAAAALVVAVLRGVGYQVLLSPGRLDVDAVTATATGAIRAALGPA